MNINWTAVGSIAAMFAIVATFIVYFFQRVSDKAAAIRKERQDRAAAIRQDIQFLHGQQAQISPSIRSGLAGLIDRQIREFGDRLGADTPPRYMLDELLGGGRASGDRPLFRASAQNSNLSSVMYINMNNIWYGLDIKARQLRGALRVFSFACQILAQECSRLCDPDTAISLLDAMAKRGDRDMLEESQNVSELVNGLLSVQVRLAESKPGETQEAIERIGHACFFIGMLADLVLRLPDEPLLMLSDMEVPQPDLEMLTQRPRQAIEESLGNLRSVLSALNMDDLAGVLVRWDPQPADLKARTPREPDQSGG